MKRLLVILVALIPLMAVAQSNNPLSIYQGERVAAVRFQFEGLPSDTVAARNLRTKIEAAFRIYPQTQYDELMAGYYIAQIGLQPGVTKATLEINQASGEASGIELVVNVQLDPLTTAASIRRQSMFTDRRAFPTLYNSRRSYLTLRFATSQMAYSNGNAWFGQPQTLTNGNPLATNPVGSGYTAWLEGFASAGVYGVTQIVPRINLNLYGGVSYLASFSAGAELFTNQSRFHGDVEEAYIGLIGAGKTASGHQYRYNVLYGRKQFILGDGFLVINTSMNGQDRAALQLNPRWASKNVFQAGFAYDRLFVQAFSLRPNELPILNSRTTINGLNLELGNRDRILLGGSFLYVPQSDLRYYTPDGGVYSREGLQVYNLRFFKSANPVKGGLFLKTELAYERNSRFAMNAWAGYGELGWSFVPQKVSVSYRFAYFSGDDPESKSYNRWDALYTGGTGEQWVQGSNMYKIVQNSNEMSHRLQVVYSPIRKLQLVAQGWLFYAPQLNNLGGNPALSTMKSHFYGSEINLTLKYFHSRHWYFHLNTAYTIPGGAIRDNLPTAAMDWFCLSAFARYSF